MNEREPISDEAIEGIKTIIYRASDNAKVVVDDEIFPMATDTVLIKLPKMKCFNSKLFHEAKGE